MSDLFDWAAGHRAKEAALEQVGGNSPPDWKARARAIVLALSLSRPAFTSDDVWQAGLDEPHEPRALGAVMNSLAKSGAIEKTGAYVQTARKTRHNAPIAVWRRAHG